MVKKSKRISQNSDSESDSNDNDQLEKLKLFQMMQMQFMEASGIEVTNNADDEDGENSEDDEIEEFDDEDMEFDSEDDVEEFDDDEEEEEETSKGPEIITFQDIPQTKNFQTGKSRFLSKKISKMEDSVPGKQNGKPKSKKETEEEKEDLRNDAELNALLNDSGIIKQFVGSQLVGKDKRKFQKEQLKELGMKGGKLSKIPKNVRMQVRSDMFRKAEEEITKAKETGMYHKSIRSQFKHNQLKAQNQKSSDRGLQVQIGRERNGVLHIHKRDIEAASQSSKPKKFKSGKGGSAGPGFKPNTKFGKGGKDRGSKVERMMNKYKF